MPVQASVAQLGLFSEGLILPGDIKRTNNPIEIKVELFFQMFSPILNILAKIIRVLTGYSFWAMKLKDPKEIIILNKLKDADFLQKIEEYTIKEKFVNFGMDLLRIVLSPLLFIAAIVCFIYSLVDLNKGQRLFVNLCELFKGNAISRWNRDVKANNLDESLMIRTNYLFPSSVNSDGSGDEEE